MGAAGSPEMSVPLYQTTRHHMIENISFHGYCHENLKLHMFTEFGFVNPIEICYL